MSHRHAAQRTFASAALLVAFGLGVPRAHAQPGSNPAAEALFDQGKALMAAGKASEACPKFEESQKLDPGSGTLINLARCYEQTGRTASAWSAYRDAASAARAAGNLERERGARERASALAPKVSKLTIEVPSDARVSGLVVLRDGVEVGPPQWGVPIPTDEGSHELSAKAPGYQEWRSKVTLGAKGATATASVPKLVPEPKPVVEPAPAPPSPEPPPASKSEPASETAPANTEPASGGLGGQRIGALVVGGVGVVGLGVGGFFGFKAMSNKSKADETCDGTECTSDEGVTAGKDAHDAGNISTIAMIAGGVLVAGGAVLWLTAPSRDASTQVGVGPSGLVLRRSF